MSHQLRKLGKRGPRNMSNVRSTCWFDLRETNIVQKHVDQPPWVAEPLGTLIQRIYCSFDQPTVGLADGIEGLKNVVLCPTVESKPKMAGRTRSFRSFQTNMGLSAYAKSGDKRRQ